MKSFIREALARGLSVLGDQSTLNGTPCGPVNIQESEVVSAGLRTSPDDNPVVMRPVASFGPDVQVEIGALLQHPDGTYRIDARVEKTVYRQRYVVMKADA